MLLASTYSTDINDSFFITSALIENLDKGWIIRYIHANGASLFFLALYIHIGRGIYYKSFLYTHTWSIGVTIFLLTIITAFIGYVLPVNQMSFWGASVITNLFSEIPILGPKIVQTIWGGPSVHSPTIYRFFTFHFVLPFLILALTFIHITLLHTTGSSNPLGLKTRWTKIPFHIRFSIKDVTGIALILLLFILLTTQFPLALGDDENFVKANPSVTPQHIQPEWYFLFAYAILRSIPNKLGGVIALALSVLILYVLPYLPKSKIKSTSFYPFNQILFWFFTVNVILLTWIGARPVEEPYVFTGQILTITYFSYYLLNPVLAIYWDKFYNI